MRCLWDASMTLSNKQLEVNRELAVREDMVLGVGLGNVDLEAEWTVVRQVELLVSSSLAQVPKELVTNPSLFLQVVKSIDALLPVSELPKGNQSIAFPQLSSFLPLWELEPTLQPFTPPSLLPEDMCKAQSK